MCAAMFNKHRVIRRSSIKILTSEPATIPSLRIIVFESEHPRARRKLRSPLPNGGLDISNRTEITINFPQVASAGEARMSVGVDEPRNDGFTVQVDLLRPHRG